MKILLVHHAYPPRSVGGSELYTAALARTLAERHEVSVLHGSAEPGRPDYDVVEEQQGPVRVLAVNNRNRELPGFEAYRDPRLADVAGGIVSRLEPDVVHVGHLSGLSTGLVFEARERGAAVVMTLHDFATLCPLGQLLDLEWRVCPGPTPRRCLGCVGAQAAAPTPLSSAAGAASAPVLESALRFLARASGRGSRRIARRLQEMHEVLRAADALVSPSHFLKRRMEGMGVAGIEVLPNGHEPLPMPARRSDPFGKLRVGFVGSAIPSKGVHVLAEAWRRLGDPRVSLRIHGAFAPYHGDTGYLGRVRRILGHEADDVLRGAFAPDRLAEILSEIDVLVVPSLWEENAPLTVQEAFLARLPVVVSDHGGLAEMVRHEQDGLRFRPGDSVDLARTLRRLLDDPALLRRLGVSPPPVMSMAEHAHALTKLYARARQRHVLRSGRVGVVVLHRSRPDAAERAVASALAQSVTPRVVVVRNGPGETRALAPEVETLALPRNLGFAGGMNAGLRRLRELGCDRMLLLNDDATLEPGALRKLAEALESPSVAAVAPLVVRSSDGRLESRGARFDLRSGRFRLLGHGEPADPGEAVLEVEALSGVALMLRADALLAVGDLEEAYFHSFEDLDWCVRARRAGLRLVVVAGARVRHEGSATLGAGSPERLYYATRNHLRAAERLLPLAAPRRFLRSAGIVGMNVLHALLQHDVPRRASLQAVLAGTRDFGRRRFGARGTGA